MNNTEDLLYRANCGQLRMLSDFDGDTIAKPFVYDFSNDSLAKLRQQYNLENLDTNNELQTSIRAMRWVNQHVYHDGNEDECKDNALSVLSYAYNTKKGVSCFHQSIVLCETLIALQIYARILHMLPLSPYDFDSHVVVMAYITQLKKWIMLDPTHQCYSVNEAGDPLSPIEIRNRLSTLQGIICDELVYNGYRIDAQDGAKGRSRYYAKNMFYFYTSSITTFGSEYFPNNQQMPEGQMNIYLAPSGFDPIDHEATKARFCMNHSQNSNSWENYLSFIEKTRDRRKKVPLDAFFGQPNSEI